MLSMREEIKTGCGGSHLSNLTYCLDALGWIGRCEIAKVFEQSTISL